MNRRLSDRNTTSRSVGWRSAELARGQSVPGPLRSRRGGSSLVQAVITMTVMSVLMTISAGALFRMYRQQSLMVERTFQTSTWLQMSRMFRQDVHAATVIRRLDDADQLEMATPEGRTFWFADEGTVRRVVTSQESDEAADVASLRSRPGENFTFVDSTVRLNLSSDDSDAASVATVEILPLPTPGGARTPISTVVVAAGLDHRFTKNESTSEGQP